MALEREIQVEHRVAGGDGFARLRDGRAAFIPGAVPGDKITPKSFEDKRDYVRIPTWDLVEASPDRVTPACRYFGSCGGCDWMSQRLTAQLRSKVLILRETLQRVAKISEMPEIETVASEGLGYRRRTRLHVDAYGKVGFHGPRSHELVVVEECLISTHEISDTIGLLSALSRSQRSALTCLEGIELRHAPGAVPCLVLLAKRRQSSARAFKVLTAAGFQVAVEDGAEPERWPLDGGLFLQAAANSFTQINWGVNVELVRAILAGAESRACQQFIDLYCGIGNFALPLAAAGLTGVGVEQNSEAVRLAAAAADEQDLDSLKFASTSVERWLSDRDMASSAAPSTADLVIADPPRRGLKEVASAVAKLASRYLCLCSCDPVSLGRDLRVILDEGFELQQIVLFDMFPHTHHAETLVWLARS